MDRNDLARPKLLFLLLFCFKRPSDILLRGEINILDELLLDLSEKGASYESHVTESNVISVKFRRGGDEDDAMAIKPSALFKMTLCRAE